MQLRSHVIFMSRIFCFTLYIKYNDIKTQLEIPVTCSGVTDFTPPIHEISVLFKFSSVSAWVLVNLKLFCLEFRKFYSFFI
jgi:hypothetical protein